MAAKLIIFLTGRPLIYGYKRGPFSWSETHKLYLFDGKELTEKEFNECADKVLKDYSDLHPSVRIARFSETTPPPPPISTVAHGREITVDEAEEVLQRLAPELLKKKTGRKPADSVA